MVIQLIDAMWEVFSYAIKRAHKACQVMRDISRTDRNYRSTLVNFCFDVLILI